jgi:hypothetical protein
MVDAWKKTKQINRNEVRVALDRAAAVWEELVNEGKERRGTRGKG